MNKKMIVMDLDGTLLNSEKKVDDNVKKYLLMLKNKGHIIVIATGRVLDSALQATDGAEFSNYIISNSGGLIYNNNHKKIIFKSAFSKELIRKICSLYNDNFNYIDLCDSHYYHKYTDKEFINAGFSKIIDDYDKFINEKEIFSMGIAANYNIENILNYIHSNINEVSCHCMYNSFNEEHKWLEIVKKGVSKYNSIKFISELEYINNNDIIAFGDSNNDLDMIKNVGVGVAMGNAVEAVKKVAQFITNSNDCNGIMTFLEQYFNNKIVIFDWGGVVESHKDGEFNIRDAIVNTINFYRPTLKYDEIIKSWIECDYIKGDKRISETDNIDEIKNWYLNIKNKFNINCSFEEFILNYDSEFMKIYFYKDVVSFAHSLKDKCKIGILSNLSYLDKKRINMQMNLDKFDHVWLSFELGARKPNNEIYHKVESDLIIDPSNILFIDDTVENINAASIRGWNTCLACGYELDKIKNAVFEFLDK